MVHFLMKYKWLIITTLLCIALSLYFHELETVRRGYRSVGGEFTIPFYPVIFYGLQRTNKEMKEVVTSEHKRTTGTRN